MRAGRKPKPTDLKILQGSKHKERINLNEPKFDKSMPECPTYLDKNAKEIWQEKAKELHQAGILTVIDSDSLAIYAQLFSRLLKLEKDIKKEGLMLNDKINPKVVEARLTIQQVRQFSAEFGMTPSSRTRLSVVNPDSGDEVDEFLNNKKKSKIPKNVIKVG